MYEALHELCCLVSFADTIDDILKTAFEEQMVSREEWVKLVDKFGYSELHDWAKTL